MKPDLRGHLIAISSAGKKKRKNQITLDLNKHIAELEKQHKKTGSSKVYKQLLLTRHKLEELEAVKQ